MAKADYRLQMFGFPVIENIQDLANYTHLSKALLYKLSKYNSMCYRIFKLPKKKIGFRKIYCPTKEMKSIQAWILRNILQALNVSDFATGFVKGKNIYHNAERHKTNRYFLCLDIDNFFPSITYAKVYNVFRTIGYNPHVSHILASFCTYRNILPQGAITSPALSNIICIKMDNRIAGYVGKRNITYTRYADDMTFSSLSDNRLVRIKDFVAKIIQDEGFELNKSKTRFLGPNRQRKITGLIINEKSFGIGRKSERLLRAKIHRFYIKPLPDQEKEKLRTHISGWLAYMQKVDFRRLSRLIEYTIKDLSQDMTDLIPRS